MFHWLKHTTVRCWLTLVFGGSLALLLLSHLPPRSGTAWPLTVGAAAMATVFALLGWGGNRLARRTLRRWLAESGVLERAGRHAEARTALRKAVAVYDSFLLSPLARSGLKEVLTARLARFFLARADRDDVGATATRSYLNAHPGDKTLAEAWLRWLQRQEEVAPADEAVAERIAEAQPDSVAVQQILGARWLASGRTDFPALEIYRRAIQRDRETAETWNQRLALLFLNEGRADDFALETYLAAWPRGNRNLLRRGLAACLLYLPAEANNRERLARAENCLGKKLDAVDLEILSEGFSAPAVSPEVRKRAARARRPRIRESLGEASARIGRSWQRAVERAVASRSLRRVFGSLGLAVAAAVAGIVVYQTFGHLMAPAVAPAPPAAEKSVETAATDPFTIQVAAYLKREYAERYVAELLAKRLDARWQEARSKDNTWYQVRISHFPDKTTALAFGEGLKKQGVIDDFYVVNYARP